LRAEKIGLKWVRLFVVRARRSVPEKSSKFWINTFTSLASNAKFAGILWPKAGFSYMMETTTARRIINRDGELSAELVVDMWRVK